MRRVWIEQAVLEGRRGALAEGDLTLLDPALDPTEVTTEMVCRAAGMAEATARNRGA